jgi:hypothetical protein
MKTAKHTTSLPALSASASSAAIVPIILIAMALLLAGCREEKPAAAHEPAAAHDHDHDHDQAATTFDAARGLRFSPEFAAALGIRTTPAAPRVMSRGVNVVARVYSRDAGGSALAVAVVPPETGNGIGHFARVSANPGATPGGATDPATRATLTAISSAMQRASNQVELLFTLAPAPPGNFVALTLSSSAPAAAAAPAVPAVPRTALLAAASGTFVYVARDNHFQRTPVRAGVADASHVEITSGIREGDAVVVAPVEQLWLVELRLTKGGGHSH